MPRVRLISALTVLVKRNPHVLVAYRQKSINVDLLWDALTLHELSFSLAAMSVAGPSRVPREYEEDLTRMIAQLDLTDIEILQTVYDDRAHRGDRLSDHEVAFTLLMQDARQIAQINADRELAQSFAIEEAGEFDLTQRPATRAQPVISCEPAMKNTTPRTWGGWVASFFSMPISSDPTPSNHSQAPAARSTGHNCVICQDPIFEPEVVAPCGHFYDIGCITDLFQSATRDESLYPPRCCRQVIPLPRVQSHLTQALLTKFQLKTQEFGTLKRVYCASPACSQFLGPLYEGFFSKVFACTSPACTTTTCGKCRGRYEGRTHDCTPDAETEGILTLSRASGWSRCPGCAQMIELNMGCFHMTCRCKTEFCYLCSARWKSCECPMWDENRLIAAAERQVDVQLQPAHRIQPLNHPRRAPVPRLVPPADDARHQPVVLPRELMVRETTERLRMHHDCQHTTWRYQRGNGRCEHCSVDLPNYVYQCTGCQILNCNRCRRNRL